jgi:Tol biopolymer transport system component
VVRGDLSAGGSVHAGGAVVHAQGAGAITRSGAIVFAMPSDAHAQDLWRLDPSGTQWSAPVRLTGASKYAYNTDPILSPDETQIVFDCADQPYTPAGTAICAVGVDGSGLHVVLGPNGVQPEFAGAQSVTHPAYAPDGSVVFSADHGDTQIWRLPSGTSTPELVGTVFKNDNAPCVLPNGSIASLWYSEASAPGGGYVLKVMGAEEHAFVLPPAGDVAPDSIACGA